MGKLFKVLILLGLAGSGSGTLKVSSGIINLKGSLESDRMELNYALFEVSGETVNVGPLMQADNNVPPKSEWSVTPPQSLSIHWIRKLLKMAEMKS